jgi:hypothetical protein
MAFGADFRRRWRSWTTIALLISVVGGLVLAAAAAGRRTESAFPRFVATYGFDADVYTNAPLPHLASVPGVTTATEVIGEDSGQPTCACTHPINPGDFGVIVVASHDGTPFVKLVSGHMPDPSDPDQVLATYTLQQDGVHLGSVIHVPFYARSQLSAYNNAVGAPPTPGGPTVALHLVGFEATEFEFPSGGTPTYNLYATPAFARKVLPRTASSYVYFVRLRDGAGGLARFEARLSGTGVEGYGSQNEQAASVEASIHPQAIGWWILAGLAALVGLAVVGQALGRQSVIESEEYPTLAALGVDRRQLIVLGTARTLIVGLFGAAGAAAIAFALSPIAPLGEARVAETSTGFAFDPLALPLGGLATPWRRTNGGPAPVRRWWSVSWPQ